MKAKKEKAPSQGWGPTPHLLYRQQSALGLTNNEITLILHVSSYQFSLKDRPFPKTTTLARDMGVSVRAIQKWKSALIKKALLRSETKIRHDGTHETSYWDFSPLWHLLQDFVPGTQMTLFPNRNGDGGIVKDKNNKQTPVVASLPRSVSEYGARTTVQGEGEPLCRGRVNGGSPHEVEEVEEEPKEEENSPQQSGVTATGPNQTTGPNGYPFFADELQVPPELERIRPEALEASMTKEEHEKLLEEVKARGKQTREAQVARRSGRSRQAQPTDPTEHFEKPKAKPGVFALEKVWHDEMIEAFPGVIIGRFSPKERGQTKKLLESYPPGVVADTFRYLLRNWKKINERIFKGTATYPGVGLILALPKLALEAQDWARVRDVVEEYEAFWKAHPDAYKIPSDLEARFGDAEKVLKSLGLK